MNHMNKTAIWQKIEKLREKIEHNDCVVALPREYFEEATKNASDFEYIEIENVSFSDLLETLRKKLATLPMKSIRNSVVRIGTASADGISIKYVCSLLETIREFTSGANLIWGTDVDPVISSGCYSVAVVFAMSGQ